MNGTTCLITGGAGFVGSNLARRLLADGAAAVLVVDNLLSSERDNLPRDPRLTFREGSIADDGVLAGVDDAYDHVFHLATYHGNQSSIHDPLADHEHNQLTTLKLFERLSGFRRVKSVVYSAAGCAVAAKTEGPPEATAEDGPVSLEMDSPYSISKLVGELYAVYYQKRHGLPTVRARFQNVYGPREILGAGRWRGTPATVWRNVVPTFVYRSMKGEPLQLEGGGRATRDFIYVDDVVEGLVRCAVAGVPGEVYNLASGTETSIRDLAATIDELTGNRAPAESLPARDWDRSVRRFGSTAKAKARLGFRAAVGLREGLGRTLAWTREQLPLIESCIARHAAEMERLQRRPLSLAGEDSRAT